MAKTGWFCPPCPPGKHREQLTIQELKNSLAQENHYRRKRRDYRSMIGHFEQCRSYEQFPSTAPSKRDIFCERIAHNFKHGNHKVVPANYTRMVAKKKYGRHGNYAHMRRLVKWGYLCRFGDDRYSAGCQKLLARIGADEASIFRFESARNGPAAAARAAYQRKTSQA
jgi:hypothetical protein